MGNKLRPMNRAILDKSLGIAIVLSEMVKTHVDVVNHEMLVAGEENHEIFEANQELDVAIQRLYKAIKFDNNKKNTKDYRKDLERLIDGIWS